MYGPMLAEGEIIYSKRYFHKERIAQILQRSQTEKDIEKTEKALARFKQRFQKNQVYILLPERQKKGKRFVALAKEFSQRYEVDIDIKKKPFLLEVSLHLYCATYPENMTHRLSDLLHMCDRSHAVILLSEESNYTLILDLYTHKRCRVEEV